MCLIQTLPFLAFQTSGLKGIRVRHHANAFYTHDPKEFADDVQQNLRNECTGHALMFPYSTYLSLRKQRQGSQKEAVQNKGGLCYSSQQEKKKTLIKTVQQCIHLSLSTLFPSGNICISKREKTGHCCIIIID